MPARILEREVTAGTLLADAELLLIASTGIARRSSVAHTGAMTDITAPDGWEDLDGRLHRELTFADFSEAFAFMTRVALAAEKADHHPDWSNSWNTVVIDLVSHDADGLTERDVALAEAVNRLVAT
jgi:4a-hydroxytetrahydrobiopterin dehydratase